MRTSYSLLRSYIPLSTTAEELSILLTQQGLEVENLFSYGNNLESFLIAEILSKTPHPQADKLSICKISTGDTSFDVVCGATNFQVHDKVVFAPPGTVMPDRTVIQETTIRGIASFGMLCSGKELQLFDSQEGLWILPKDAPVGSSLLSWMPEIPDQIFDIALTPNRGDCLSTLGIAREIAMLEKQPLLTSSSKKIAPKEKFSWDVKITSPDCRRYLSFVVRGVQVTESPLWLKMALKKYGLRSINNIVDISNYVMLERGTPIHIFDLDTLHFPLRIRNTDSHETITLLSGEEISLPKKTLVISDSKDNVALAGVMGGIRSGVSPKTTNLFIEIAHFSPDAIRETTKALNIHSDASYRFLRNIDTESLPDSMQFLLEQLLRTTPGELTAMQDLYPSISKPREITLSLDLIQKKLGFALKNEEVEALLTLLSFSYYSPTPHTYQVSIPSYRNDCHLDMDVIEELIRLYGYEKLPSRFPAHSFSAHDSYHSFPLEFLVRDLLTTNGLQEIYNFSFLTEERNIRFSDRGTQGIALVNPLNSDFSHLRTSLLAAASPYLEKMLEQGKTTLHLFEIGQIFYKKEKMLQEKKHLLLLKLGKQKPETFLGENSPVTFYDLKDSLHTLFGQLGIEDQITYIASSDYPFLHPHKTAQIFYQGDPVGYIGEIHPEFFRNFKKKQAFIVSEVDLSALLKNLSPLQMARTYRPFSRFPKIERDLSFILDKSITAEEILNDLQDFSPLISATYLADQYEDQKFGDNKKNLSFHIIFQSMDQTLTDEDIQPILDQMISWVQKQKNGILREF